MNTLVLLAPEILLVAVAVAIYLAGAFLPARGAWWWLAFVAVLTAGGLLATTAPAEAAAGPLQLDRFAYYARWLALGAGALLVLAASRPLSGPGTAEYVASILLTVPGAMFVAGANDLVLLFTGLELVSIPTYILLYLGRRDPAAQEAAAKYFYLSVLASAVVLYGLSFLYGVAGSSDLGVIRERLAFSASGGGLAGLAKLAAILLVAGLGFRVAAVPFHFYAPDVFQGTTHANAGFLSVVPKLVGFVALVRVLGVAMQGVEPHPWRIALALAVVTMTLGNVLALLQNNLRRLLAYSSVAHAGYMLIGLAVSFGSLSPERAGWDGIGGLFFYLVVYAVATLGTFAALACLGSEEREIASVDELAGLAWTEGPWRKTLAWSIALFMFSLTGIPPLAGFWGKLAVFASALGIHNDDAGVRRWFTVLAVIGVVNAAISAGYYLRIIGVMFFRSVSSTPPIQRRAGGALAAAVLCAVLAVAIGLFPRPWLGSADWASPARAAVGGAVGGSSGPRAVDGEPWAVAQESQ